MIFQSGYPSHRKVLLILLLSTEVRTDSQSGNQARPPRQAYRDRSIGHSIETGKAHSQHQSARKPTHNITHNPGDNQKSKLTSTQQQEGQEQEKHSAQGPNGASHKNVNESKQTQPTTHTLTKPKTKNQNTTTTTTTTTATIRSNQHNASWNVPTSQPPRRGRRRRVRLSIEFPHEFQIVVTDPWSDNGTEANTSPVAVYSQTGSTDSTDDSRISIDTGVVHRSVHQVVGGCDECPA